MADIMDRSYDSNDITGNLRERIAYLQGLSSGLRLKDKNEEGRLLVYTIDIMEQLLDVVEHLREEQNEINEYLSILDSDLENIEKEKAITGQNRLQCMECSEEISPTVNFFGDDYDAGIGNSTCPSCGGHLGLHNGRRSVTVAEYADIEDIMM